MSSKEQPELNEIFLKDTRGSLKKSICYGKNGLIKSILKLHVKYSHNLENAYFPPSLLLFILSMFFNLCPWRFCFF